MTHRCSTHAWWHVEEGGRMNTPGKHWQALSRRRQCCHQFAPVNPLPLTDPPTILCMFGEIKETKYEENKFEPFWGVINLGTQMSLSTWLGSPRNFFHLYKMLLPICAARWRPSAHFISVSFPPSLRYILWKLPWEWWEWLARDTGDPGFCGPPRRGGANDYLSKGVPGCPRSQQRGRRHFWGDGLRFCRDGQTAGSQPRTRRKHEWALLESLIVCQNLEDCFRWVEINQRLTAGFVSVQSDCLSINELWTAPTPYALCT